MNTDQSKPQFAVGLARNYIVCLFYQTVTSYGHRKKNTDEVCNFHFVIFIEINLCLRTENIKRSPSGNYSCPPGMPNISR